MHKYCSGSTEEVTEKSCECCVSKAFTPFFHNPLLASDYNHPKSNPKTNPKMNLTPKGKMSKNWPMMEAMDQDEWTMNLRIHEEDKEIMTSDGTHGYEYPPQHYPTAMDQMADNDQVLNNRSSVTSNNK